MENRKVDREVKIELTLKEAEAVRHAVKTSVFVYTNPAWVEAFCNKLKKAIDDERQKANQLDD